MNDDQAKVDAIRAVTQFSDDYIRKALTRGKKQPTGPLYPDWVKIQIAAGAYDLGLKDGRDGR
jgi:hypothetical protein